jgi:hypothetical protein
MRMKMVVAALSLAAVAAAPAARERVVEGDRRLAVTLRDVPGTLVIDPGAPTMPMLSADYAARAGLKPGMFRLGIAIGPKVTSVTTAVETLVAGSERIKRRTGWSSPGYLADADGVIGPGALPDPVIRFQLRAPIAGERTVALPLLDGGGLVGGWFGLFARIDVGGEPVRIRFDLSQPDTVTNAGTAITMAEVHGGILSGEARPAHIAFGIERPVRAMRLERPVAIGPLSLSQLWVRTTDYGNGAAIREEGADPEEIVVVAKGKRDRNRDRITVGTRDLQRCSSIVFDKPAKQVRLTCA